MRPLAWHTYPRRLLRLWRSSLQARTVAITVLLSGVAVLVIGSYITITVGNYLFDSTKNQVQLEARTAHNVAQQIFEAASPTAPGTSVELDGLSSTVQQQVLATATGPSQPAVAIWRAPDQVTNQVMPSTNTTGFPQAAVSNALRQRVDSDSAHVQYQSVSMPNGHPAIVVGSQVKVPDAGNYELYLVYDLTNAQSILGVVQQTVTLGGLALVILIAVVTWVVVRLVVGPVRVAAETSEKLADGQLEHRLPQRGEDVIATLARSFNRMADSLQTQITKLAELSRVQQRFVSDVSHELRTPLTTIRLAGDVLYDHRADFDPSTARTAELLHAQVQRFEVLLADLLEVSRYDAGAVELDLEPTNLVHLVEDAIESVAPLADERGSDLRLIALGGYFDVEVDARRIRRIVRNLLGNAIEHGEGAPIVLTIDSNESAIALAVRDHGIGMTPAEASRVFDRFWRADPSRRRTIGGTGLGLAISLEDAALHEGSLEVWSERGVGTCFRLTIPRERGRAVEASPIPLPPEETAALAEVRDA